MLEPVLTYRLELPEGAIPTRLSGSCRSWRRRTPSSTSCGTSACGRSISSSWGRCSWRSSRQVIAQRFGVEVSFGAGSIVYRETIAAPVEGVGHFEPLRHYAEVHLLLEPGGGWQRPAGRDCLPTDQLDLNWQRLILTHLLEREHLGVLTGSPSQI